VSVTATMGLGGRGGWSDHATLRRLVVVLRRLEPGPPRNALRDVSWPPAPPPRPVPPPLPLPRPLPPPPLVNDMAATATTVGTPARPARVAVARPSPPGLPHAHHGGCGCGCAMTALRPVCAPQGCARRGTPATHSRTRVAHTHAHAHACARWRPLDWVAARGLCAATARHTTHRWHCHWHGGDNRCVGCLPSSHRHGHGGVERENAHEWEA